MAEWGEIWLYRLADFVQDDDRTWEQVLEGIEHHRWTPPPGTPSTHDLIREDRDNDEPYR